MGLSVVHIQLVAQWGVWPEKLHQGNGKVRTNLEEELVSSGPVVKGHIPAETLLCFLPDL